MPQLSMKELLEAGVHFGHQTRRWNPKMKRYIYGARNGIYILDLHQTIKLFEDALNYVQRVVEGGGTVLFVGTKKQAQSAVKEAALRSGQYFVTERWLGGMLTNWDTIQQRIQRLKELDRMTDEGYIARLPKKEQLKRMEERDKLNRYLEGIRTMEEAPAVMFVVDLNKESIAVKEAKKLNIPVIAIVDTNCDPDIADYVIPGNDDAIRAGNLMCRVIADAVEEGRFIRSRRMGATIDTSPTLERTAEEEAEIAAQQAEARQQAALAAAEREARIAAAKAAPPAAPAADSTAVEADVTTEAEAEADIASAEADIPNPAPTEES